MDHSSRRGQILLELVVVLGIFFLSGMAVIRLAKISEERIRAHRFTQERKIFYKHQRSNPMRPDFGAEPRLGGR